MSPTFRPRAFIFDLDGTIVDNMALHAEAFARFAARHGLPPLTAADRARLDGRRNSEIFPLLFGRDVPREEWLAYEEEKEALYRELSRGRLRPLTGLVELLGRARQQGIAVGLATSAPADNVAHTLHEAGLSAWFPMVVRGDQVSRGKPAPDVFLAAAEALQTPAEGCLAFEDAPIGVTAARAAGMRVVALTTSFAAEFFRAAPDPPDGICADFQAFLTTDGAWLAGSSIGA
ncbi:MAG: HAD family phosphatase [Acidobacteriota bacterium]